MKRIIALVVLTVGLLALPAQAVQAAQGKPSIVIVSPRPGAVLHGSTITLRVAVHNFRLVPPVWKNPPVLKGKVGNIEYQLDGPATFNPTYDITASTTHRWTNVRPGKHTLMAFLATSQHVPYPSGPSVHLQITLLPAAQPQRPAGGPGSPGVARGPTTGGAADMVHNPLNYSLLLAVGLAILILGLALLSRRFAFAGSRAQRIPPRPTDMPATVQSLPTPRGPILEPVRMGEAQSSGLPPDPSPGEGELPGSGFDLPAPLPGVAAPAPPAAANDAEQFSPMPAPLAEPAVEPEINRAADTSPPPSAPQPAVPPITDPSPLRDRAVEMAQQWSQVVESLVRRLDEQEAERRRMLEHIRLLEQRLQGSQDVREQLRDAAGGMLSPDDLSAVRYVADSLMRDPDHIVVLAAVAQNAGKLHDLVESYTRLRETIDQL